MAHTQLATSPATMALAVELGGTDVHVGTLAALPVLLLFVQPLAALAVARISRRKWIWFACSLAQRLSLLPIALGPWLFANLPDHVWLGTLLGVIAIHQMLLHFSTPLWMAWMSDYLPHRGLSEFWGVRHRGTQWAAAASLVGVAIFSLASGLEIRFTASVIFSIAMLLGLADSLLFIKVPEPQIARRTVPHAWAAVSAPFRHRDFRSFILYSCWWNFACMVGAPFISIFLLGYAKMSLFQVLNLWALSWVGGSMFSKSFGRLVERHGQRPVMILCTVFKASLMFCLLLVPANAVTAFWMLLPAFMLDALLNSGITIANNSFLLKVSPQDQRVMFIAAGMAFAGLAGGLTSIATGEVISNLGDWSWSVLGKDFGALHLAFAVSLVLRLVSVALAVKVVETGSHGTRHVVSQMAKRTAERVSRSAIVLRARTALDRKELWEQ